MGHKLLDHIQEVVRRNPQSRDEEDQELQKRLFWDLARVLPSFTRMGDPQSFIKFLYDNFKYGEEFLSPIFYYLQDANWNKVDVDNVENWKLWYPPTPALRREAELPPSPSPSSLPGTVVNTRKREVFLIKEESDEEDNTSEESQPPPPPPPPPLPPSPNAA